MAPEVSDPGEPDLEAPRPPEEPALLPAWYVRQSARDAGDGKSWATAFNDLQAALAVATFGDDVWIAAGIYTPSRTGDRAASFVIRDGVALYGGFAGHETRRTARDPARHLSVLSGDLAGDDQGDLEQYRVENSELVVRIIRVGDKTVLDGLSITGGYGRPGGAGVLILNGSPVIRNVAIHGNMNYGHGAGVYFDTGSPRFEDVVIADNWGFIGVGMSLWHSDATFVRVRFERNYAYDFAAAINITDGSPQFVDAVFAGNTAYGASAVSAQHNLRPRVTKPRFVGTVFRGNEGSYLLQGLVAYGEEPLVVEVARSTVIENAQGRPGGWLFRGSVSVTDSTIADNTFDKAPFGGAL